MITDAQIIAYAKTLGMVPAQLLPRMSVRQTSCPECLARAGKQCRGKSGLRDSNHLGRVFSAIREAHLIPEYYKSLELASPSLEVDITVHKLKGKVWVLLATEELPQIGGGRN